MSGPAVGGVTQLFTGDCLFPGGVGKTWEPGAFTQLLTDVQTQLFDVYPDSTVVYPVMVTTPHSAPNAPTSASGGTAAGRPRSRQLVV